MVGISANHIRKGQLLLACFISLFFSDMKKRLSFCLIILGFVISVASTGHAITYTFTTIDAPGASKAAGDGTFVSGVNNSGKIAGYYIDTTEKNYGFLYAGGSFQIIGVPGYFITVGTGINNSDKVVGGCIKNPNTDRAHGFLYVSGSFKMFNVPGADETDPFGINDTDEIVGTYVSGNRFSGFLYADGSFNTIDIPGYSDTLAYGINNAGDIVGFYIEYIGITGIHHGFVYAHRKFTTIDFPGASYTRAYGINDSGAIVGSYCDAMTCHGFLYVGGNFTTIDVPGASETDAFGINDSGAIVGNYFDASYNSYGFIATPPPAGPDLTGSWTMALFQACRTVGKNQRCSLKGTFTVSNVGNKDASSTQVKFYLSDNAIYEDGDTQLKSVATGKFKPGKSKAINVNLNLTTNQTATGKYIIAVIDKDNLVTEIDEENNIIVFGPIQ